jgi:hypothetical protein
LQFTVDLFNMQWESEKLSAASSLCKALLERFFELLLDAEISS